MLLETESGRLVRIFDEQRFYAGAANERRKSDLHEIAAYDPIKRAMLNLAPRGRKGEKQMRWVVVTEAFGLGSTYAKDLCHKYGLDPDELLKR